MDNQKVETHTLDVSRDALTEHSGEVETPESIRVQLSPGWPPAKPPEHGRGWPLAALPGSIAHAMGCGCGNCLSAQHREPPIDFEG